MANKFHFRRKKITLVKQELRLLKDYPSSHCTIRHNKLYWKGMLKASPLSESYKIKIKYQINKRPVVTLYGENVKALEHPNFPHHFLIFPSKQAVQLCLNMPTEFNSTMFLSDTIIPWTQEWLFHYELWLIDSIWKGGGHAINNNNSTTNLGE